jgi:aminoglycoside 3-N-acetyltransferase
MSSNSPILLHTDVSKIDRSTLKKIDLKKNLSTEIHRFLLEVFPEQELWFPAFNYDFIKTRVFDPKHDPIQVGALNESLRNSDSFIRSEVPVFSIIRQQPENKIEYRSVVNPFDSEGEFSEIRRRDGNICFFGATIESMTFIHFVENLVSIPYRYMKRFPGQIKMENGSKETELSYLVRPKGIAVEYDWPKIYGFLQHFDIGFKISSFGSYDVYNANALTDFMVSKYSEDVFWTLKQDSKDIVERKLNELGRGFEIQDFELENLDV